jgi:hypothetical protein
MDLNNSVYSIKNPVRVSSLIFLFPCDMDHPASSSLQGVNRAGGGGGEGQDQEPLSD